MWVSLAIAVVVVLVVAWFAVTLVTERLDATPSMAVFDIEEATTFIADRLPDRVAGRLSHDDVRVLLRWQLTYLRERGVASFGRVDEVAENAARSDAPMVADEDELVDELIGRARDEGLDADEIDIVCVSDLTVEYMRRIGAIGDTIDLDALPPAPRHAALPVRPEPDVGPTD